MQCETMSELIAHIQDLRESNEWDEKAFHKLYPLAKQFAFGKRNGMSVFMGEAHAEWFKAAPTVIIRNISL